MISGVYAIIHRPSGAAYIGSSRNIFARWAQHVKGLNAGRHHAGALVEVWLLSGASAFVFLILEECAIDDLASREQEWLDSFETVLNGSRCVSASSLDPNVAKRIGDALRNRPKTAAHIASLRARLADPELRARISESNKGKGHDAEWRRKVSAAKMGHAVSPATRVQLRAAMQRRWAEADPVWRERVTAAQVAGWTPEARAAAAERARAWQAQRDPEEKRAALSRAGRAATATPEAMARHVASVRAALARPETKAALGAASRRWWAAQSPEERSERMRCVRNGKER